MIKHALFENQYFTRGQGTTQRPLSALSRHRRTDRRKVPAQNPFHLPLGPIADAAYVNILTDADFTDSVDEWG